MMKQDKFNFENEEGLKDKSLLLDEEDGCPICHNKFVIGNESGWHCVKCGRPILG